MKKSVHLNQSGQISKMLIVIAGAVFLMMVVVYMAMSFVAKTENENSSKNQPPPPKPEDPVYEATLGDIRFYFDEARDLGNFLDGSRYSRPDITLSTTEKFIKLTVGAQNQGKYTLPYNSWSLGNIVDEEGKNFTTIDDQAFFLLPESNLCGASLKPDFSPTPCVKVYEVSKNSNKLKVEVFAGSKQKTFIDLNVTR